MAQVTLRDYLQETEDAISAERVDDALTHCQTILAQFPESLEAQRLLGEVYLALERLNDAQQNFDWVLINDPENVVTYCDRALISEHMSDYDTALDCYQQAYELSRGNSQIRQEFNQLSAKAGQQGFMLSRAGLARMYMRGDLLTQAMQEWEAVLAVSPERLDARTGLLETCWREGLYNRVEQLAMQILQDVPGCLKALLLLAYVTAPKNMQKAQELLQRAGVLDPDHMMAQELFADTMASQPAEPFLKLLRKSPTLVETSSSAVTHAPGREEVPTQHDAHVSTFADTGTGWDGTERTSRASWESDTLVGAPEVQSERHASAAWAANAAPVDDVWSALERQPQAPHTAAEEKGVDAWSMYGQPMQDEHPQNTWLQELQGATASDQKRDEPAIKDSAAFDRYKEKEPSPSGLDTWEAMKGNNIADTASAWSSSSKEETAPAPPAWLNMLTQSEKKQASDPLSTGPAQSPVMPAPPPATPVQPPATPVQPPATPAQSSVEPVARVQPIHIDAPVQKEEAAAAMPESMDGDEPFSFGPEWLKSLGAASIDAALPLESSSLPSTPPAPEPEPQPVAYEEPAPEALPWEVPEPQQVVTPEISEDQRLLKTLEELESDLRSQGFVPLQPNSLSSLAQKQEPGVGATMPEQTVGAQEPSQEALDTYKEPALSSALAELDNYIHQSSSLLNTSSAPDASAEPAYPAQEPAAPTEEPSWLAALGRDAAFSPPEEPSWMASPNSVPAPGAEQIAQDETMANLFVSPEQPFWAGLDIPQEVPEEEEQPTQKNMSVEIPNTSSSSWSWNDAMQETSEARPVAAQDIVSADAAASPIWPAWSESNEQQEAPVAQASAPFASATTPSGQLSHAPALSMQLNGGQEPRQSPAPRSEALFDSELEMTMKRPAVRLQPVRSAAQKDTASSGRTWGAERTPGGRTADGNMSYQERLVKGYQHQLFGDYDEAMQEYRVIIRSAPELLTDVVSNVRALLKLAPKYAAGYRVLGDAYMRQGEYLQAMEAYNKALTMAKRAKS